MPHTAGFVAVVLVEFVERVRESIGGKDERIGDEIFYSGVMVGAGLVAQKAGGVQVVREGDAGPDEQVAANPVERLLRAEVALVRVAAVAEARGVADGEAVAGVDDDLRQLAPDILIEGLLEGRGSLGVSAENRASYGSLRGGKQVGREVGLPAGEKPLAGGLA